MGFEGGGVLKDEVEAEHAGLGGSSGGLVGGQQVDEEFQPSTAQVGSIESNGGTDIEAVEDVGLLGGTVPMVVGIETLGQEAWLEVESGGEGGIEAESGGGFSSEVVI